MARMPNTVVSPLFASRRERRFWILTLLAVAAVYANLLFASLLTDLLHDHDLAVAGFVGGLLLVSATVLALGLRLRPRGIELGVALGIIVVYFMLFLRLTLPERSHLMEYGVVAAFTYEALTERRHQGRHVPAPALLAVGVTSAIGVLDEAVQALIPTRVYDPQDILFNVLAAFMAVTAIALLRWVRRRVDHWRERRT